MPTRLRRPLAWLLASCLLLAGCWDLRELEETAFAMALGLEWGAHRQIQATVALAAPQQGGGGGDAAAGGKPAVVTTVTAPTLMGAINLLDTYVGRRVSLLHTKVLVLGENFTRTGGLQRELDALVRVRELRRSVHVLVARDSPADFLAKVRPEVEKDSHRYLEFLPPLTAPETGLVPPEAQLNDLVSTTAHQGGAAVAHWVALRTGAKPPATSAPPDAGPPGAASPGASASEFLDVGPGEINRTGGPNVEFMGGAVLHRGLLVGTLSGAEMRLLNMLRGDFRLGVLSVPDPRAPGFYLAVELRQGRPPEVQPRWTGGAAAAAARVFLEGDLQGVQSGVDYTNSEAVRDLEQAITDHLTTAGRQLLSRSQQELRADIVGFGFKAARLFATFPEWQAYDWDTHYPAAKVDASFSVKMRRFGGQGAPPRLAPAPTADFQSGGEGR